MFLTWVWVSAWLAAGSSIVGDGSLAAQMTAGPTQVLFQDDPAAAGALFGSDVDAWGDLAIAAGRADDGSADLALWERITTGAWLRTSTGSLGSCGAGTAVATDGVSFYRLVGNCSGLDVQRRAGSGPWETLFTVGDADSEAVALGATRLTAGGLAVGFAVAVAYRTPASSRLPFPGIEVELLENTGSNWFQVYSDSFLGLDAGLELRNHWLAIGKPLLGEVDVVDRSGSGWALEQTLTSPQGGIRFGQGVSRVNLVVAVGAPDAVVCVAPPDIGCEARGQVYVYRKPPDGSYTLDSSVVTGLDGTPPGSAAGTSVSFHPGGNWLAVGAPGWPFTEARGGLAGQGAVIVARPPQSGGVWTRWLAVTIPLQPNELGTAVTVAALPSGAGTILAGAPAHLDGNRSTGAVLVFGDLIFADGFESGGTGAW